MTDYHAINQAYETHWQNEWERMCDDSGEWPEQDYDLYAEAEAMWEMQNER